MIAVPVALICHGASARGVRHLLQSRRGGRAWVSRTVCSATPSKSQVVFLGTPEVAATVLARLLDAAEHPSACFQVSAVVSQPASSRGRGRRAQDLIPTPVAQLAADRGLPPHRILTPDSARDEEFLASLAALAPDVCVTAAYGNVLPKRFLAIPRAGTVNIHPSLLPLYRGAAPVQRALEDGVTESGVSLAFTVRAMDAGAIIAQQRVEVGPSMKSPHLLLDLFTIGTSLLLHHLPSILDGSAALHATMQEEAAATHAAKVRPEEARLSSFPSALTVHNKVRAFAGWPGSRVKLKVGDESEVDLKILTTRVGPTSTGEVVVVSGTSSVPLTWGPPDCLQLQCQDGSVLEVVELQPLSKKAMGAKAFWNGLRGREVYVQTEAGV